MLWVDTTDLRELDVSRLEPMGNHEEIILGSYDKIIKVGKALLTGLKHQLTDFLLGNANVFVWCPIDMLGIDWLVIMHQLSVDPHFKPVQQVKGPLHGCQLVTMKKEVYKLKDVDFIDPFDTTSGSQMLLVKKVNDK